MSSLLYEKKPLGDSRTSRPLEKPLEKAVKTPSGTRSETTKSLLERHFKMPSRPEIDDPETDLEASRPENFESDNQVKQPALESRNVTINGKRTSIRLEPNMWDALEEICVRERRNMHQTCTHIHNCLSCSSFTAAVRVYALSYFRTAATEMGHSSAGHGPLKHEPRFVRRY